jgi:hypothetical protein
MRDKIALAPRSVNEGLAMSSFEWVELETLTSDIETARSRLVDARKRNNQGAVAMLETEITRAEKRRAQLLAHISTNVATSPEPVPRPAAKEATGSRQAAAAVAAALPDEPGEQQSQPATPAEANEGSVALETAAPAAEGEEMEEPPVPDSVVPIVSSDAASPAAAPNADRVEGDTFMWDQLKPSDIARAKAELGERRAEMLARHAEELKGLEADQSQLETLEQAIDSFLRKFTPPSPEGAVVKLDQERELRQQGTS